MSLGEGVDICVQGTTGKRYIIFGAIEAGGAVLTNLMNRLSAGFHIDTAFHITSNTITISSWVFDSLPCFNGPFSLLLFPIPLLLQKPVQFLRHIKYTTGP